MKKIKLYLMILMLPVCLITCEKDTNEEEGKKDPVSLNSETISAKWEVSNKDLSYSSFEFNKSGNYIVAIRGGFIFGTYEIIGENTIELSDFGTMESILVYVEEIEFTIIVSGDSGDGIEISASKSDVMENSTNTQLLCRTWEMISIDDISAVDAGMELNVLFSEAGTYLVTDLNDPDAGGLAQWKWKDSSEEILCYSWSGAPTCDEESQILVEVTGSSLLITEDGIEYFLLPVDNTKSTSTIPSSIKRSKKQYQSNFFGM